MSTGIFAGISGLGFLIWLAFMGVTIYLIVLIIKLARRGIIALDLYIASKNRELRSFDQPVPYREDQL